MGRGNLQLSDRYKLQDDNKCLKTLFTILETATTSREFYAKTATNHRGTRILDQVDSHNPLSLLPV